MAPYLLSSSRRSRIIVSAASVAAALLWQASPVHAQLDPTLFLKRSAPNVLLVVDTANRMERDAPVDPANALATSNYYDPFTYSYTVGGATWETVLGVAGNELDLSTPLRIKTDGTCGDGSTTCGFTYSNAGNGDKFNAGSIVTVGNTSDPTGYAKFSRRRVWRSRARPSTGRQQNQSVARFGLIRTRQNSPTMPASACNTLANCQVNASDPLQSGALVSTERAQQQQMVCHASNGWRRPTRPRRRTGRTLRADCRGFGDRQRGHPDDSFEGAR